MRADHRPARVRARHPAARCGTVSRRWLTGPGRLIGLMTG